MVWVADDFAVLKEVRALSDDDVVFCGWSWYDTVDDGLSDLMLMF